mmetsp:Transcript_33003/g.80589  ORF Transcript_33003/g.80589 Transcript_33003/m.80589 type:complete len:296 (-) Transcript_33003:503-1390(-)
MCPPHARRARPEPHAGGAGRRPGGGRRRPRGARGGRDARGEDTSDLLGESAVPCGRQFRRSEVSSRAQLPVDALSSPGPHPDLATHWPRVVLQRQQGGGPRQPAGGAGVKGHGGVGAEGGDDLRRSGHSSRVPVLQREQRRVTGKPLHHHAHQPVPPLLPGLFPALPGASPRVLLPVLVLRGGLRHQHRTPSVLRVLQGRHPRPRPRRLDPLQHRAHQPLPGLALVLLLLRRRRRGRRRGRGGRGHLSAPQQPKLGGLWLLRLRAAQKPPWCDGLRGACPDVPLHHILHGRGRSG